MFIIILPLVSFTHIYVIYLCLHRFMFVGEYARRFQSSTGVRGTYQQLPVQIAWLKRF